MSSNDLNKIVGSGLVALLVAVAIGIAGNEIYNGELGGKMESKPAYSVAVTETPEAVQEAEPADTGPEPIAPLLATASADDGAKVARPCFACHTFEKGGGARVGPNLWGVVGQPQASVSGFTYSPALSALKGRWTYEELNKFLTNPQVYAPGTKMGFSGLKKISDRANLILFLRSNSDSPAPLP